MTGGPSASSGTATALVSRPASAAGVAGSSEYSARLAALAGFTIRHKALVIGSWVGVAVLLAMLFPQLETVVRTQSCQSAAARCAVVANRGPDERGLR